MFSDRLSEALKNNGMTGNSLCKKLNIENRSYTNWKNNKLPRSDTLKEIANVLNVSTDWLLEREEAPTPEETRLLTNYRKSDERGKEYIQDLAEREAGRTQEQCSDPNLLDSKIS